MTTQLKMDAERLGLFESDLTSIIAQVRDAIDSCTAETLNVRLQVTSAACIIYMGDPSYDRSRRGLWSQSRVSADSDPIAIAASLLSQARSHRRPTHRR